MYTDLEVGKPLVFLYVLPSDPRNLASSIIYYVCSLDFENMFENGFDFPLSPSTIWIFLS